MSDNPKDFQEYANISCKEQIDNQDTFNEIHELNSYENSGDIKKFNTKKKN